MLKLRHNNFKYRYLILIPKFHIKPIKFCAITIGCNTYSNNASKFLLRILKQIYDFSINNNSHCLKNGHQLIEYINKLKNITKIVTYDFTDLFNSINLNDLNHIINLLFKK